MVWGGVTESCFRAPPTLPARALRSDPSGVAVVFFVLVPALPREMLAKPRSGIGIIVLCGFVASTGAPAYRSNLLTIAPTHRFMTCAATV